MAKSMGADVLGQPGTADRHLDGFVDDAWVHMVAARNTSTGVYREVPGGEDRLPAPLPRGMGILPSQRMGQVDLTMPLREVLLM